MPLDSRTAVYGDPAHVEWNAHLRVLLVKARPRPVART
jgi:hypothetical protein